MALTCRPCFRFLDSFSLGAQFCCRDNSTWLISLFGFSHCCAAYNLKPEGSGPHIWNRWHHSDQFYEGSLYVRPAQVALQWLDTCPWCPLIWHKPFPVPLIKLGFLTWLTIGGVPWRDSVAHWQRHSLIQHSGSISPMSRANRCKSVRNSSAVSSGQRQRVVKYLKASNESVP